MASISKSIRLTTRSLELLRDGEPPSVRVNQIFDRYAAMLALDSERVRARFTAPAWAALMAWRRGLPARSVPSIGLSEVLENALDADWPKMGMDSAAIREMSGGEVMALIEAIEYDLGTNPPPSHS